MKITQKILPMYKSKEFIGMVIIVVLFIISSILSQQFSAQLQTFVEGYGVYGALFYVLITIGAIVLAPLNTFFLLPVATAIWGPFVAAILSIIGWTLGALIAYFLARTFGHPFVVKFTNLQRLDKVSHALPQKNIFIWIVLARMAIPVDILSYALGLFIVIPYSTYTLATFIGVSPFAFMFAYASDALLVFGALAGLLALVSMLLGVYWFRKASQSVTSE